MFPLLSLQTSTMASSLLKQVGKTLYWFPTAFFATTHFYDIKTVSGRSMQVSLSLLAGLL